MLQQDGLEGVLQTYGERGRLSDSSATTVPACPMYQTGCYLRYTTRSNTINLCRLEKGGSADVVGGAVWRRVHVMTTACGSGRAPPSAVRSESYSHMHGPHHLA